MSLLAVDDLVVDFDTRMGVVRALDGAHLDVEHGELIGVVGESGSGKSTLATSVGRLLPPSARVRRGELRVDGASVFDMGAPDVRRLRRERLAFVFQNPMTSLDPTMRVGRQMEAALERHGAGGGAALVADHLARVGLDDAGRVANSYPHMLSGGMAQRVAIAMALAGRPDLVVADEPTASVDASIRAQILELIFRLAAEARSTVLFLSHDLRSVARHCERVAVMYGGRVVEIGTAERVFRQPVHPYTQALLRSSIGTEGPNGRVRPIPGLPPILRSASPGCAFAARCEWAIDRCLTERPERSAVDGRDVLCHRAAETVGAMHSGEAL